MEDTPVGKGRTDLDVKPPQGHTLHQDSITVAKGPNPDADGGFEEPHASHAIVFEAFLILAADEVQNVCLDFLDPRFRKAHRVLDEPRPSHNSCRARSVEAIRSNPDLALQKEQRMPEELSVPHVHPLPRTFFETGSHPDYLGQRSLHANYIAEASNLSYSANARPFFECLCSESSSSLYQASIPESESRSRQDSLKTRDQNEGLSFSRPQTQETAATSNLTSPSLRHHSQR